MKVERVDAAERAFELDYGRGVPPVCDVCGGRLSEDGTKGQTSLVLTPEDCGIVDVCPRCVGRGPAGAAEAARFHAAMLETQADTVRQIAAWLRQEQPWQAAAVACR